MNWQIIVGVFFLIGGIGNITNDFSAFLFGIALGIGLLFWGAKKKGYIKPRKTEPSEKRILTEETFHAVGVSYYENNIRKLANVNPDWKLSATKIISEGKAGKRIFLHHYVNKPVKLQEEPNNVHDKNAVAVIIAGELVGYISREDNVHVKDILQNREIISTSGFIGGGEYKVVSEDGETQKTESGFTVNIRIKYI